MGRRRTLSETYGTSGWHFTFEAQKWSGDWQTLLGINTRCQHLTPYSIRGMRKRDYPPTFFHHQPWWKYFPVVEDYFARACFFTSVGEPVRDCLIGAGPRESLSRMMAADPALVAVSVALLLLAVWLSLASFRRLGPSPKECGSARAAWLAVVGATIVLAGVGMMALGDRGYFMPRHTLLPAIGVSMMLGSVFGGAPGLRGLGGRTVGAALLAGLLIGPSVLRLGDTYEWTTRARVTERLLASLDELYPTPEMADLLVIDGVRKYGRGFCNSSGLSGAVSLHRGIEVKVITLVRRERDRLYGNRPWDVRWEIDPDSTPFLVWNEAEGALRAVTFEEFVARHPELKGHSS